jgi:hypothetical protein
MRRMPLCEQCRILTTNIAFYVRSLNCAVFNVFYSFNPFGPRESSFLSSATNFRNALLLEGSQAFPAFPSGRRNM